MPGMANDVISRRWKPGKRDGFKVVNGYLTAFVSSSSERHKGLSLVPRFTLPIKHRQP
jgi:hypothetical protein